jgi:hypothetical protein
VKTLREYINIVEGVGSITDDWFKDDAFKAYKRPNKERYEIAQEPGTINTLEGPVKYPAGYYIMTGPKGEQYPISPKKFKNLKDDLGNGVCTPKKIVKLAKMADHAGSVDTSWGERLYYSPGEDIIVRHGENDYGVVKKDIFAQTYERVK